MFFFKALFSFVLLSQSFAFLKRMANLEAERRTLNEFKEVDKRLNYLFNGVGLFELTPEQQSEYAYLNKIYPVLKDKLRLYELRKKEIHRFSRDEIDDWNRLLQLESPSIRAKKFKAERELSLAKYRNRQQSFYN